MLVAAKTLSHHHRERLLSHQLAPEIAPPDQDAGRFSALEPDCRWQRIGVV
jgi:hypothetical protein